ncbi:MAG: S-methyl-5'-thioadenosine phosphorylase [Myxococcales bacterium]|nr:S-methyl-5'-thioadenosine phosphorylase [Myxococcales bacterium]
MEHQLGIIGGSGLYEIEGLTNVEEVHVETPFGAPSDAIVRGQLGTTKLSFLPRHGRGHRVPPHRINYRANIFALKKLGVQQLVSVSAVGSLKEEIAPGDMVLVDQFIDRTRVRRSTFFDDFGIVAHVAFGDPVDRGLQTALAGCIGELDVRLHTGGTYICIDGPQFSSRAESELYRSWGASVIGMTNLPEAKLAREAELPYATLAMATDYDCWHESEEDVTVDAVVAVLKRNAELAKQIIGKLANSLPDPAASPAVSALESAIITAPEQVSTEARAALAPILAKYFDPKESQP